MAIRDMDVAAEVIGIRPMYAKLTAFAVSSFIVGVAGALWGFVYLGAWEPLAFDVEPLVPAALHGDHRRAGLDPRAASSARRSSCILPIVLNQIRRRWLGIPLSTAMHLAHRTHGLRRR